MKILFISNGHGEDIIASRIIKELASHDISAYPIVGKGSAFDDLKINVLGGRKSMPSGGFVYQNAGNMLKDLLSGLIGNTVKQIKNLRSIRGQFDIVVSIGDIVPIVGALLTKTRFVFVGCAKSCYYSYNYTPWEKYLLKKYCLMSFPRDKKTHDKFLEWGIRSSYVGNPMMDCIDITGDDFGIKEDHIVIGILPGTRDDAHVNMEDIFKVATEVNQTAKRNGKKVEFLVAASNASDTAKFKLTPNMRIIRNKFGDVLNRSAIVIGMSGTGNEQASGLRKPVVSFPGRGIQYTASFANRQTQLLGEALALTDRDPVNAASTIWSILNDKSKMSAMGRAGAERMGGAGASRRIAEFLQCG